MSIIARTRRQEAEWQTVSERNHCPICDASQGCHRDLEGAFACCARQSSDWPLTSGQWLHRVDSVEGAGDVTGADLVTSQAHGRRSPVTGSMS